MCFFTRSVENVDGESVVSIKMLPILFKEYMSAFEDKTDISMRFRDYLRYSSFPQAIELYIINPENINLFLDGIYNTVATYVEALIDSFFVYKANRYDIKRKEFLKMQEKYYAIDIGLRYYLLGQGFGRDMEYILGNEVYLEQKTHFIIKLH